MIVTVTVTLDPEQIATQLEQESGESISAEDVSRALDGMGEASIIEKLREGLLDYLADSFA
jgi:hypothetical protein